LKRILENTQTLVIIIITEKGITLNGITDRNETWKEGLREKGFLSERTQREKYQEQEEGKTKSKALKVKPTSHTPNAIQERFFVQQSSVREARQSKRSRTFFSYKRIS
jgi:hypothetical protein